MALTVTWNDAFENSPANTDSPSEGDDKIREVKDAVRERAEQEHLWKDTTLQNEGKHLAGSARAFYAGAAPTTQPNGSNLSTVVDPGRLWVGSSNAQLNIWTGANWVSTIALAGLNVSGALNVGSNLTVQSGLSVAGTSTLTGNVTLGGVDGTLLKFKVIEIGDWDIDASPFINIAHSLGGAWKNVRSTSIIVRNDADTLYSDFLGSVTYGGSGGIQKWLDIDSTNFILGSPGDFQSIDYNSTSYNRGWITVCYTA